MAHHPSQTSRGTAAGRSADAERRSPLALVVDNTAAPAPAARPGSGPMLRPGLPPEIARLMAVHGAPVHRALGIAPRPRLLSGGRPANPPGNPPDNPPDDWWWSWSEEAR